MISSSRLSAFTIFILIVEAANTSAGARSNASRIGVAGLSETHAAIEGSATISISLSGMWLRR